MRRVLRNIEIIEVEEEVKSIDNILHNYKNSEFIPNNIINELLNYYLPSVSILHKFSDNHLLH